MDFFFGVVNENLFNWCAVTRVFFNTNETETKNCKKKRIKTNIQSKMTQSGLFAVAVIALMAVSIPESKLTILPFDQRKMCS